MCSERADLVSLPHEGQFELIIYPTFIFQLVAIAYLLFVHTYRFPESCARSHENVAELAIFAAALAA